MKNLLILLAKSLLLPLGLTAAVSETDPAIQNMISRSGTSALIILNEDMEHIMKIFKSLEESSLLIKWVSETIKMNQNKKKVDFLKYYQVH